MASRTVYGVVPVDGTQNGTAYFTRKDEAFRCAREVASEGHSTTVQAHRVTTSLGGVALFVALLSDTGWAQTSTILLEIAARKVEV